MKVRVKKQKKDCLSGFRPGWDAERCTLTGPVVSLSISDGDGQRANQGLWY